jgi:beta-glucanase (GH16 family)
MMLSAGAGNVADFGRIGARCLAPLTLFLSVGVGACGTTGATSVMSQEGGAPQAIDAAPLDATPAGGADAAGDGLALEMDASADGATGDGSTTIGDASTQGGDGSTPIDAAAAGGPEQCMHRAPVDPKWKLTWSDEFEKDGPPDPANWGFEQGFVRNQELQWYEPDNATVASGLLTIAARRQTVVNPNYVAGSSDWKTNRQYAYYTSSSMTTMGKQSFEYGRFEMCGKIDTTLGSWPAFWILGDSRSWPSSGEVDIMEYYTNYINANVCKPSGTNCNWAGSVRQSLGSLGGATWASAFHLWAMEWDSQNIKLYLDDVLVYPFSVASAVSSGANPYTGNPFYIIVNEAVGANGGDPTNTTFPISYEVDYVRVYRE